MAHNHNVIDTDPHYRIDGVSRTIVNISETKRELVQFDHNSERFTFEIPRYVDGHDFSQCNVVQVHYENKDTYERNISADIYDVDDLQVKSDDNNLVMLSWLIKNTATQYAGTLGFSICFSCIVDEVVEYAWNTKRFDGITILPGMNNSNKITEQSHDVIADLAARVSKLEQMLASSSGLPAAEEVSV